MTVRQSFEEVRSESRNKGGKRLRVVIVSPQFAEYSIRLYASLRTTADVMLVLERQNAAREWPADLAFSDKSIQVRRLLFKKNGFVPTILDLVSLMFRMIFFRPHIVHVQEWPHPNIVLLTRVMGLFATIVLTVHDPTPHSGRDAKINRRRLRRSLRTAAGLLLAHGSTCRRELSHDLGATRASIEETAHGVLLTPTPDLIRTPIPGRLLFFGRMEGYKGLETLLDAADLLVKRGVSFSLHLAGSGPELTRLRSRIDAAPWIILEEKFLPPREAIQAFQASELVVLPYLDATQSGVTAAAFGNGRPVIATRVGGLVDVVQDKVNGRLVPANDPYSLADAIQQTLTCPELLITMRSGAEESARTIMNWDKIAQDLHARYQMLELLR